MLVFTGIFFMREIRSIEIREEAHVGMARRAVHEFAQGLSFAETELAEIDIVVQEIATNAVSYATGGGRIHFTRTLGEEVGLELFYWDAGPGIYNIDRALRDGVSTSGSLGAGLGAIRRLMDEFEVYSTVHQTARLSFPPRRTSHGTALLARKWLVRNRERIDHFEAEHFGAWSRPRPGERENGDAYIICKRGAQTLCAVVDGLGHGAGAKEAADVALDAINDWTGEPLDQVFMVAHDALRATRGVVMGAVVIDRAKDQFYYAGVGNISVRVFGTRERMSPISTNGTLGTRMGKVRVWEHEWTEGATFIITSDGLSESWDAASYPGLLSRSPQMIAGLLMRDYKRDTDDATVLVARI